MGDGMEYDIRDIRFGEKELTVDAMVDIKIWEVLEDYRVFKELFKYYQELGQYDFRSQFFILQHLTEYYIKNNSEDSVLIILDYMYLITGLQPDGDLLKYNYYILNNISNKIKNKGEMIIC